MTIEELKERHHNAASNPGEGASISVEEAGFAGPWCMLFTDILALVEAVSWDISESETEMIPCGCDRPVCVALRAFNAKLASL